MLHTGRYIYVIFMCHMALEKALKALITEETQQLPPRTHNLIDLAQRAQVALSQAQQEFSGSSTIPAWWCGIQTISPRWSPSTLEAIAQDYSRGRRSCFYGYARPEITDIIARYCAQLEALGIRVEQAILFGSHARGEAKEGSDIDVLIVSSDFAA